MRSGKEGGGKGPLVQTEKSGTLGTVNDQTLFCFRLCSEASNSMKSSNPNSGTYETQIAPTLDTTEPTPAKGQGGLAVVAIAGNIVGRKPENGGNGDGFKTDGKMYTLTATDRPGVCYENHAQDARYSEKATCPTVTSRYGTGGGNVPLTIGTYKINRREGDVRESEGIAPTLEAAMGEGGGNVPLTFGKVSRARGKDGLGERWDEIKVASTRNCMDVGDARTQEAVVGAAQVRRLTLVECERLQGFSDNYTQIPYRGKPAERCPDAPRYKAIGNSWAVPVVRWIGQRIDDYLEGKLDT